MRFKVKEAWFDDSATILPDAQEPTATVGSQGRALLAFFLVGRDQEDRREWARGQVQVSVRRAENGRWQFESFAVTSLESMVALRDLFSEVAVPAGVSTRRPAYGTVGNREVCLAWGGGRRFQPGWLARPVCKWARQVLPVFERRRGSLPRGWQRSGPPVA